MRYWSFAFLAISLALSASTAVYAQTYDFDALKKTPGAPISAPPRPQKVTPTVRPAPPHAESHPIQAASPPIGIQAAPPDRTLQMRLDQWQLALNRGELNDARRYVAEIEIFVSTHYGKDSPVIALVKRLQAVTKSAEGLHAEAIAHLLEALQLYRAHGDEGAIAEIEEELDQERLELAQTQRIADQPLAQSLSDEREEALRRSDIYDNMITQFRAALDRATNFYIVHMPRETFGEVAATLLKMAAASILLALIWPFLRASLGLTFGIFLHAVWTLLYLPYQMLRMLCSIPLKTWGRIATVLLVIWMGVFSVEFVRLGALGFLEWLIFMLVLGLGMLSRLRIGIAILLCLMAIDSYVLGGTANSNVVYVLSNLSVAQWFSVLAVMFVIFISFRRSSAEKSS